MGATYDAIADGRDTIMRGWFGDAWKREMPSQSPADRDPGEWLRGSHSQASPAPEAQPQRRPDHEISIDR